MRNIIEAPFTLESEDRAYIEEKLNELRILAPKTTQVRLFFKLGDGKDENDIAAEIMVRVPGKDAFAAHNDSNMMVAFNKAFDAVHRQLKKRKEKMKDHQSDIKDLNDIVQMNF